jgi:hypothetical protein
MSGTGRRHYVAMAKNLKDHRRQTIMLAREVGLEGVSKTKGVASMIAVLDDAARFVAYVFADDNDSFQWAKFMDAAGFGTDGA